MKPPVNKNKKFYRPNELNKYQLHYKTPNGKTNSVEAVSDCYFNAKKVHELAHPNHVVTGFSILKQNV